VCWSPLTYNRGTACVLQAGPANNIHCLFVTLVPAGPRPRAVRSPSLAGVCVMPRGLCLTYTVDPVHGIFLPASFRIFWFSHALAFFNFSVENLVFRRLVPLFLYVNHHQPTTLAYKLSFCCRDRTRLPPPHRLAVLAKSLSDGAPLVPFQEQFSVQLIISRGKANSASTKTSKAQDPRADPLGPLLISEGHLMECHRSLLAMSRRYSQRHPPTQTKVTRPGAVGGGHTRQQRRTHHRFCGCARV
jgi:hypothetical protein